MVQISPDKIIQLFPQRTQIRNVCIVAHVDHGKTTLSDSLLASNGIISNKLAGKIRFMDCRKDEQEREITMFSRCFPLLYDSKEKQRHLINLIDSPGHVDFESQVSVAAKLSQGCLLLVDVVEGICAQTKAVLKQVLDANLVPCLVLNKIDRLILELKMTPLEAFEHLKKLVDQINSLAILAERRGEGYFSPLAGNVVFSSAIDGWAFRLEDLCIFYLSFQQANTEQKTGIFEEALRLMQTKKVSSFNANSVLLKAFWNEFAFDSKGARFLPKTHADWSAPMFVQFVFEPIWKFYDAVLTDWNVEKIGKFCKNLSIILQAKDLTVKGNRAIIKQVLGQWIPLASCIFEAVSQKIPPPKAAVDENETVVNVAKMIPFKANQIPVEKQHSFQESTNKREEIIRMRQERLKGESGNPEIVSISPSSTPPPPTVKANVSQGIQVESTDKICLIGMAYLESGTLKIGDNLSLRCSETGAIKTFACNNLYLLMGNDLAILPPNASIHTGCIFGIGGEITNSIVKTATLYSNPLSIPEQISCDSTAISLVKVAVEPKELCDLDKLRHGLELLNQVETNVEVSLQKNGQYVIGTSGELHLEQVMKDLTELFAQVEVNYYPQLPPFRETILEEPMASEPFFASEVTSPFFSISNTQLTVKADAFLLEIQAFPHLELKKTYSILAEHQNSCILSINPKLDLNAFTDGGGIQEFIATLKHAFRLAVEAGPLCGEPMENVRFHIERIEPFQQLQSSKYTSMLRAAFKRAFLLRSPRLKLAMYACEVQTTNEMLGRVCGVIARRAGRIISETFDEDLNCFHLTCRFPVAESVGFATELRKKTCGLAVPQLLFDGYHVLKQDPFSNIKPSEEDHAPANQSEEETENRALKYILQMRERRGMFIDREIQIDAQKQSTLKR